MSHVSTVRRSFPPHNFFVLLFFLLVAICLFSIPLWDGDFWWHIGTGRFIVENKMLPRSDPFSFTSQIPENKNLYPEREKFILTQYWLAQILFFLIFKYLGPVGIITLRNVLLISCLIIVIIILKKRGIPFYLILPFTILLFISSLKFTGERPVLFTILFTLLSFVLLESYVLNKTKTLYFLPLLMLLWANLHGGFILGNAIIVLFMLTEGVKFLFKKSSLSEKEILIFYGIGLISIILSGINPNGFNSFYITFSKEFYPFTKGIQEYAPTIENIYKIKLIRPDYGHLILLGLTIITFALRNKKFNLSNLIILLFFAIASFQALRFTIYFSLISSFVLPQELHKWIKEDFKSPKYEHVFGHVLLIVSMVSLFLYIFGFQRIGVPNISELSKPISQIEGAVNFVEKNKPQGNMLNSYGSGGYIAWRLYPAYSTFIDSRGINLTVMYEYGWIFEGTESIYAEKLPAGKVPLWKRLLNHYRINFIISEFHIFGHLPNLLLLLLDDPEWVPVYIDFSSIVFVRDIPEHKEIIKRYKKDKRIIFNYLIANLSSTALKHDYNPRSLVSLGKLFVKIGNINDAIKAYELALKKMPEDKNIKQTLEELKTKKEGGKKP